MSDYSIYPKAIDGYAQIPLAVDRQSPVNAEGMNRFRSAIINIENTLGVAPHVSGVFGEFPHVDARITNLEEGHQILWGEFGELSTSVGEIEVRTTALEASHSDLSDAHADLSDLLSGLSFSDATLDSAYHYGRDINMDLGPIGLAGNEYFEFYDASGAMIGSLDAGSSLRLYSQDTDLVFNANGDLANIRLIPGPPGVDPLSGLLIPGTILIEPSDAFSMGMGAPPLSTYMSFGNSFLESKAFIANNIDDNSFTLAIGLDSMADPSIAPTNFEITCLEHMMPDTTGGNISIRAGKATGTGVGGQVQLSAGEQGGFEGSSISVDGGGTNLLCGGDLRLTAGDASGPTPGAGGSVSVMAGNSNLGLGGTMVVQSGGGETAGGPLSVLSGSANSGVGGGILILTGSGDGGSGNASISSGDVSTGNSGAVFVRTGNSSSTTASGGLTVSSGDNSAGGSTGNVLIKTGDSTVSGVMNGSGNLDLRTGDSPESVGPILVSPGYTSSPSADGAMTDVAGGDANLTGGTLWLHGGSAQDASLSGDGGDVRIYGGDGPGGNGGDVRILGGTGDTADKRGRLHVECPTKIYSSLIMPIVKIIDPNGNDPLNAATVSLTEDNYTILVHGGDHTRIILPNTADAEGRIYNIKRINPAVGAPVIEPQAGELIDQYASLPLGSQWSSYTLQSDGDGSWMILAQV